MHTLTASWKYNHCRSQSKLSLPWTASFVGPSPNQMLYSKVECAETCNADRNRAHSFSISISSSPRQRQYHPSLLLWELHAC